MEVSYCRRCGKSLTKSSDYAFICESNHSIYVNSAPTSAVFILTANNNLLLARRAIDPGKGMLDTFGGFVDGGESSESAAIRELKEEASLTPDQYEPLRYFCSVPATYLFEGEEMLVLTSFFWTRLKPNANPKAADDVAEAIEQHPDEVNLNELFNEDIRKAMVRFRELYPSLVKHS